MLIRLTRDNLIGSTFHPAGETVEVDEDTGRRLVKAGVAGVLMPPDPAKPAAAKPKPETATAAKPPENAAKRA